MKRDSILPVGGRRRLDSGRDIVPHALDKIDIRKRVARRQGGVLVARQTLAESARARRASAGSDDDGFGLAVAQKFRPRGGGGAHGFLALREAPQMPRQRAATNGGGRGGDSDPRRVGD